LGDKCNSGLCQSAAQSSAILLDVMIWLSDNYMHIHVIPSDNKDLLAKKYSVSGMGMEETWRSMLSEQSKYTIVDPQNY